MFGRSFFGLEDEVERARAGRRARVVARRRIARGLVSFLALTLVAGMVLDGFAGQREVQASTNCTTQTSGLTAQISFDGRYCLLNVTWGTGTWTIPSNISSFYIMVVGGGGGGGVDSGGGGGGGGIYVGNVNLGSDTDRDATITIGGGGIPHRHSNGQVGTAGGGSSFVLNSQFRIDANGGGVGSWSGATTAGAGGSGGSASVSDGSATVSVTELERRTGGTGGAGVAYNSTNSANSGLGGTSNAQWFGGSYSGGGGGGATQYNSTSRPGGSGVNGGGNGGGGFSNNRATSFAVAGRISSGGGGGAGSAHGDTSLYSINGESYHSRDGKSGGEGVVQIMFDATYTVTFAAGTNGTGSNQTLDKIRTVSLTLPNSSTANGWFTRTGYSVTGWSTTNGGAQTHALGGTYSTDAATTFYPVWTANTLTVTYDTQGGPTIASTSTTTGGTVADPGTLDRAGYRFDGWFSAGSGGTPLSFPYTHGRTADFTLYAQWTAKPTVSLSGCASSYSSGQTCTITITLSEVVSDLSLDDFTVTRGSLSGLSTSGTTRTATFTAAGAEGGTGSIQVRAGTITGATGETNDASNTLSITVTASNSRQVISSATPSGVSVLSGTAGSSRYVVQTFTSTPAGGTWTVPQGVTSVDYLVVGGGGGGGAHVGGGGGGGGVRTGTLTSLSPGSSVSVSVGTGGTAGRESGTATHNCNLVAARSGSGSSSTFASVTAAGGGGGGSWDYCPAQAGGSGGGGGTLDNWNSGNSPLTTPAQGSNGGAGSGGTNVGGFNYTGGGGGGAGGAGGAASANTGGAGGAGAVSSISATLTYYGGGGGGGVHGPGGTAGTGGQGGGGSGVVNTATQAASGAANTGGGGGGGAAASNTLSQGGAGGSGIVIVRYALPAVSAPDLVVATGANLTLGDNGSSTSDKLTSNTTLKMTGSAAVGSIIQLSTAAQGTSPSSGTWTNTGDACLADSTTGEWSCTTSDLTPGKYSVRAVATTYLDDETVTQTSATALELNVSGAATKLSVTTQPVGAAAGSVLATQPVVKVLDANDLVVESSTVAVTATASGGTLGGTTTVNAVAGVATFTDLTFAGTTNTDYTLSFAPPSGLTTAVSDNFRVTVGTATQLVLTTSASGAIYNTSFTTQPVVEVRDAGGNKVTATDYSVTATLSAGTVVGTGNSSTAVTSSGGVASFSGLGINGAPGSYTITYSITVGATTVNQTQSITVAKAAQTITFADPANRPWSSTSFVVSPSSTSSLTVTLASSNTDVCTVSGFNITMVTVGTCTLTASQAGNDYYNAATSVEQSFEISQASQTITFTDPADRPWSATPFTLAPTASSSLTVVLTSSTAEVCSVTGFDVTMLKAGTCTLVAAQAGNTNYAAATNVTREFEIAKISQSTLNIAATTVNYGSTLTLTTSGGTGSGAVSYAVTTAGTAGCSVDGSMLSATSAGSCTVTATKAADDRYNSASSGATTITVNKISQSTALSLATTTVVYGQTLTLSGSGGDGGGALSYAVSTGTCTLDGDGVTLTAGNAGSTCQVTITRATSTNYNALTSDPVSITITRATPTLGSLTLPSPNKKFDDAPFSLTSPSANVAGAWSYASALTSVATISGAEVTITGAGSSTITATFVPTDTTNYNTSSVTATLTIDTATPTFAWSNVTATYGDSNATITAPTIATTSATGTWAYTSSDMAVAAIAAGNTQFDFGNAGTATITGTFTPSNTTNFVSGGTVTMTVTVGKATPTLGTFSVASKTFGDAEFSLSNPTATLGGSAVAGAWSYGSATTAVATVSGSTVTVVGGGSSVITATFTPTSTANFEQASTTTTLTVLQATPTFTWSNVSATYGDANISIAGPTIATTSATGTWAYTSSTDAVAAISGSQLDIGNAGSATITGTFTPSNTTNYVSGGTVTMTVTVAKATPSFTWSGVSKTFGDAAFVLTAPSVSGSLPGSWAYATSDTSVVSLSGATATVAGGGSATITGTFTPTDTANYVSERTTTMVVAVDRATPTFVWSNVSATFNDANATISAPAASFGGIAVSGSWVYTSSDTAVAAVEAGNTQFDFGNAGTATISGTFTPSNTTNYVSGGTATMTVTVAKADQTTLTVTSTSGTYGTNLMLTVGGGTTGGSVSWAVADDSASSCAITGGALRSSSAGTCTLTATMAGNDNYNAVTSSPTTVTLTARPITVKADAQTKVYG